MNIGYKYTYQLVDRGIIEFMGPEGMYRFFYRITTKLNRLPSTFLLHFLLILTMSFIGLFLFNYSIMNNDELLLIFDSSVVQIIVLGFIILFSI